MQIKKYHGLGNDYIVYDPEKNDLPLNPERVRLICHRNFGIGSDGILFGPIFDGNRISVKIYNPDGSEAEKSGNGVRIFSKYLRDEQYVQSDKFTLNTLGGDVDVEYLNDDGSMMKVMMGKVTFQSSEIPVAGDNREVVNEAVTFDNSQYHVTCLSIGNPHCVIPMESISKDLVCNLGPFAENHPMFPNKINLQILTVLDRNNIQIEIYERGAGYTLASGSSSCAAACAAYKLNLADNEITVHMPGGNLQISIMPDGSVYMVGEVSNVATMIFDKQFEKKLSDL